MSSDNILNVAQLILHCPYGFGNSYLHGILHFCILISAGPVGPEQGEHGHLFLQRLPDLFPVFLLQVNDTFLQLKVLEAVSYGLPQSASEKL